MYEMTIQCVATDEAIDFCDLLAEQIARFLSVQDCDMFVLSVHEAVINSVEAIKQLGKEAAKKTFLLSLRITEEDVTVTVADEGDGIPIKQLERMREKSLEDLLLAESGRGLLLIKETMDDIWFERQENGKCAIAMKMRRGRNG
ncbi:ATP-binding protein [Parageobacillus thermoglucosidasius]|jgi:serine/threonine-protein kinase RsbW|uniref:ATP-binding protein n=1 Tax=Parageobacillus thermoglucosidasius TaxID=1426 RepID=A0A1B7KRX3_PARTM|nr:ATP-binding protein [Parageobacillus thermoglucosidasius]OAT72844.1 ATP-binding protein [Parageobacillus thermoglucosidasius]